MPITKSQTIWPTRVSWPRQEDRLLPALAAMSPAPRAYVTGRSRFTISPIHLALDQLLFLITAALLAIGLVMVQSAETRVRVIEGGNGGHWLLNAFATKNFLHAGIALFAMTIVWRIDYRWLIGKKLLRSPATWLIALTILMLLAVFVPGLGKEVNGARRWVGIGPIQLQPSELAKLGLVAFIAAYTVHRGEAMRSFWRGYIPLMLVFGLVLILVVKEDFGTTVLVATICFFLLVIAGCRLWHLALLIPPGAVGVWLMLFKDKDSFRYRRLMAFLDPYADPKGVGYHLIQSLLTIMNGGFWGRGLGNGIQKMDYLPEDSTDFIFSVICEELGFPGAMMVILLFAAFVVVGWRIAARCNHLFGKMLAFGITAIIGLQAAMNIAVVTVSMPTKGIALPLISSGGTGWIMMAIAIGVLMSIERVNRIEAAENHPVAASPQFLGFPVTLAPSSAPAAVVPAAEAKGGA